MKQLITILVLLFTVNSFSQTPAFPCAEGYGKYTKGGRGGVVIPVTHLKDHHVITQWRDDSEPSGSRVKTFANIAGDSLPDIWKQSVGLNVNTYYGLYNNDVAGPELNIELCAKQIKGVLLGITGDNKDRPYYTPVLSSPYYDGSLRKAINTSGPRTVVFRVGGIFDAESPLKIDDPYITIAGQTAPGDGIMIINSNGTSGRSIEIATNEIIIRFLTFRRTEGGTGYNFGDNIWVNKGFNVIVDHCSLSWSSDGNFDVANYEYDYNNRVTGNLTLQYCLFTNSYGGNNKSLLVTGSPPEFTLFRNAFVNSATRNPSISSEVSQNYNFDGTFELVNNFWHDCGKAASAGNVSTGNRYNVNFVNNKRTVRSGSNYSIRMFRIGSVGRTSTERLYSSGNEDDFLMTSGVEADPEWRMVQYGKNSSNNNITVPAIMRETTPFNTPIISEGVILWNAADIETNLMPIVGNYVYRDSEDLRALNDVASRLGTENNTTNTFPTYNNGTPIVDANNDGIEDSWFASNVPSGDTYNDTLLSGYTWLEEYLNSLAGCQSAPPSPSCSGKNAPVANMTLPLAGTYTNIDTVDFSISYTSDTTVNSVSYYADNTLLSGTTSPFTFSQTGLPQGTHNVYAIVQDVCGNSSYTDTVSITINAVDTNLQVVACSVISAPVIDGFEDAIWDNVSAQDLGVTEIGLTLPDTNDLKATFKVSWDATSLYFFVKVKDDTIVQDSPGLTSYFKDDAVCVFIDGLDEDNTSYDGNDFYLAFRPGGNDISSNNTLYTGTNITKADAVTAEGYNMEIKIDWAHIGITPTVGNNIGLDFRVDDDDDGGAARDHHLLWNDETSTLWNNPSKFGMLNLVNTACQNTTSIKIETQDDLLIYPNPTNGELTITSSNLIAKIEVYNTIGALVYLKGNISNKTKKISLTNLPKGSYLIKIHEANRVVEKQIIKQ